MTPFLLAAFLLTADSTPRSGDTIVFVGDSITQAGDYVADVEAYLLACRPADYFRVINVGKSSETLSGTSEPDHHPPRPCLHDRFARDVAAFKPNVVVACYGMNDGNYFPFDPERFEKYKAGVHRLVERVFKETPARALVLLTPPAFDASRAPPPPEDGKSYGYKHPSPLYDGVLRKYSDWLLTLKSDRVVVVDVHRAFHLSVRERRQAGGAGYTLSPDAVHPNGLGHWVMARTLLEEWTVRPSWKELTLELVKPQGSLSWNGHWWEWETPPVTPPVSKYFYSPREEGERRLTINGAGRGPSELFDQRLKVVGLPEGRYDGRFLGFGFQAASNRELEAGVVLTETGGSKLESLNKLVADRRGRISARWLEAQRDRPFTELKLSQESVQQAEEETKELSAAIERARAAKPLKVVIAPTRRP